VEIRFDLDAAEDGYRRAVELARAMVLDIALSGSGSEQRIALGEDILAVVGQPELLGQVMYDLALAAVGLAAVAADNHHDRQERGWLIGEVFDAMLRTAPDPPT
jgi:hypothetical protein